MCVVMDDKKKNIVVLGAGFGGLRSALMIRRGLKKRSLLGRYRVLLVDKSHCHTYTPLLYELAAMPPDIVCMSAVADLVEHSIPRFVKRARIDFLNAEVRSIDIEGRCVRTGSSCIPFTYLVLALGSETNFFDVPGAREHSFVLKTVADARAIQRGLYREHDAHDGVPCVVIGGGGPTGVELAAEIKNWMPSCDVTLVEAGDEVLGNLDPAVSRRARARFERLGVAVRTGKRITSVAKNHLMCGDARVPFDLFVWTAGVKATSLTAQLPGTMHDGGRIIVSHGLSCIPESRELKVNPCVYVVGDMGCVLHSSTGSPAPMLARVALDQADVAAHNILESVRADEFSHDPDFRIFQPKHEYPYVIPLGGKSAVARIGRFTISGYAGWFLRGLIEFRYLTGIMPIWQAFGMWVKGLALFVRYRQFG